MKVYSAVFRRLKALEITSVDRYPLLLFQLAGGIDMWELRSGGHPFYGQVRALEEWENMVADDVPVILVRR